MANSKRGKRTTVSAIYEILAFGAEAQDDLVQQIVKLSPSKNVVRMALTKFTAGGQRDHTDVLLRAADKLGYSFRGTTYVVGKNNRLIIPVDSAFEAGSRVVVERSEGLITVRAA